MNNPMIRTTVLFLVIHLSSSALAASISFTVANEGVKMFEVVKADSTKRYEEIAAPWKVEIKNDAARLFVFEKAGFIPVYVPVYYEPNRDIEINVSLKKMDGESRSQMSIPALALADELVDEIIFAQTLVDEKKFAEALNKAEQLYTSHPQSVAVKILYGNALLMNKKFQKADSIYASVLENLPEGKDSIRKSVEALRKKVHAARMPASGGNE